MDIGLLQLGEEEVSSDESVSSQATGGQIVPSHGRYNAALIDEGFHHKQRHKRVTTFAPHVIDSMVELSGIEPLTSSLRTRRSPS
jgi:hypothetical protein